MKEIQEQPDHGPRHIKSISELKRDAHVVLHRFGKEESWIVLWRSSTTLCLVLGTDKLNIGTTMAGLEPRPDGTWSPNWLERMD